MTYSQIDRQFNRAYISMYDMERCVEYLKCAQHALQRHDHASVRGLLSAAIVSYARPFSGNADHPSAFPAPSFRMKQLTEVERKLHDHVLKLRHEAIAHSDAARNPVRADLYDQRGYVVSGRLYDPLHEVGLLHDLEILAKKAKGIFAEASMMAAQRGAQLPSSVDELGEM